LATSTPGNRGAHHRVVTVRDDLGGWVEAVEDALLNPTVDVPRGTTRSATQMELESIMLKFQQRVRR
jgi:hypothetical protein